jgi:hypothetical protein
MWFKKKKEKKKEQKLQLAQIGKCQKTQIWGITSIINDLKKKRKDYKTDIKHRTFCKPKKRKKTSTPDKREQKSVEKENDFFMI